MPTPPKSPKQRINLLSSPKTRIQGSYSAVSLFKRKDDDTFPDTPPGGGGTQPPPAPAVSSPDLALQFKPALEDIPVNNLKNLVISAIQNAYGANTDVRYLKVGGKGQIGIWFKAVQSTADGQARDRGVQAIDILKNSENFALFVNSTFIRVKAREAWDAMPKVLDADNRPDPNGPVHLSSLDVTFKSPDKIITTIKGFDERPWPDVDFTLKIDETLSAANTNLSVDSKTTLDVDTSWLNKLTGIFAFVFPPLGLFFLIENIIIRVNEGEQDNEDGGVGKQALSLIPKEIMIAGGKKLIFLYTRVSVSTGGVFCGGTVLPLDRTPEVSIQGPAQITASAGSTAVTKRFTAMIEDLRGNCRFQWKINGTNTGGDEKSANIRFNLGQTQPGQVITRTLTVTVTDADGLSDSSSKEVKIYVPHELDDNLPPICRIKPYLPQCRG
jgi:hypothetical protein